MPLATPAQVFDRLERAQSAWTRGEANVSVTNDAATGATRARFRLDLDGAGGATLRLQTPAQGRLSESDQTYALRGATLTGVDSIAKETLRRPAPDRGSVGLRFVAVLGGLDDAVGFLTDPGIRSRYLAPLRALKGWQTTATGLVRRTGSTSLTRLDLDPSGRLRALHVELPGSRLDWTVNYGPVRLLPLPKGFKTVEAFTARPRPPHYADARAKFVAERMERTLAGLRSAIVRIDGVATLWIGGARIRYETSGTGFAYGDRKLTVITPGAAYQGPCRRGSAIDGIASTLGAVDPLARSFLVRTTPYAELFPPDAKVRVVGTMAHCRILLRRPGDRRPALPHIRVRP